MSLNAICLSGIIYDPSSYITAFWFGENGSKNTTRYCRAEIEEFIFLFKDNPHSLMNFEIATVKTYYFWNHLLKRKFL